MADLRSEMRAAAQAVVEIFTIRIHYRWWPPIVRFSDAGAEERIAAVRRGERKVGLHG